MRNRIGGIVRRADRGGVRVKNRVSQICFEIDQRIERRIPCSVRPDVVEDAVIVDSVAAAYGSLAVSKNIPGKTNAWPEIFVPGRPHPVYLADPKACETSGVRDVATHVGELRNDVVGFAGRSVAIPTKAKIQSEP